MNSRVFIIHRWGGNPNTDWYQWLSNALKGKGFDAFVPIMPNPDKPVIEEWVNAIGTNVGSIDESTYFVGHSIGCQAILRFLETASGTAGGLLLVAPWLRLKEAAYESEGDREVARPWIEEPVDFGKIKAKVKEIRVIMATGDPYVPVEDSKIFEEKLGAAANIMPINTHFTTEDGYAELHAALNEFMKLWHK